MFAVCFQSWVQFLWETNFHANKRISLRVISVTRSNGGSIASGCTQFGQLRDSYRVQNSPIHTEKDQTGVPSSVIIARVQFRLDAISHSSGGSRQGRWSVPRVRKRQTAKRQCVQNNFHILNHVLNYCADYCCCRSFGRLGSLLGGTCCCLLTWFMFGCVGADEQIGNMEAFPATIARMSVIVAVNLRIP